MSPLAELERASETELVERAQTAVSRCNWEVGLCAAQWTQRYARGRTDADFAALVGLSADQVYQRRRVAERFGAEYHRFPALKWSHFYAALNWDDALECLQWAEENQATVSELRAWRRTLHEETPSAEIAPGVDFAGDPAVLFVPSEPAVVRDPAEFAPLPLSSGESAGKGGETSAAGHERGATLAGVHRQAEPNGTEAGSSADGGYAPFRAGAGSPAPAEQAESPGTATTVSRPPTLQILKRATRALRRINADLTEEVLQEAAQLPAEIRNAFTAAVAELSAKAASLP